MATQVQYAPGEIVRRGKEIYETSIRDQVEPVHIGEYLAIDIESGRWEIGKEHDETIFRAFDKFGHSGIYGMRIGYHAAESFGGIHRPINEISRD
jgi:hypothetical protein